MTSIYTKVLLKVNLRLGNNGQNVKHGQDKLGAENGRNEPKGNGTKDDETVNIGKSKDRTIL